MNCSSPAKATAQVPIYVPELNVDVEFTGTLLPDGWSMQDPSQIYSWNPLGWCGSCYCDNGTANNVLFSPSYTLLNDYPFTVTLKTYIEGGNNIGYNGWYLNFSNGTQLFLGESWDNEDCTYVGPGKGNTGWDDEYLCYWDEIAIADKTKGYVNIAKANAMHAYALTFTPGSNILSVSVDGGSPVSIQMSGTIPGKGGTFNLHTRNSLLCAGSNTTPGNTYTGPQITMQVQSLKINQ